MEGEQTWHRWSRRHWLFLDLLLLFAVVAVVLYAVDLMRPPSWLEFESHRGRYERLVAANKARGASMNQGEMYGIGPDFDPRSIHHMGAGEWPARSVESRIDDTGRYEITVMTQNNGHFGSLGYIYFDGPSLREDFPVWPIRPHWWAFHASD